MSHTRLFLPLGILFLTSAALLPALAGDEASPAEYKVDLDYAQVEFVVATQTDDGSWRFDVTVRHNDEGWDHYADVWEVVATRQALDGSERSIAGEVLAERVLLHPHDTEQPFTRSQSAISIPDEMTQVLVRAGCNVHGLGGRTVLVDLTASGGELYEVYGGGRQ